MTWEREGGGREKLLKCDKEVTFSLCFKQSSNGCHNLGGGGGGGMGGRAEMVTLSPCQAKQQWLL